MEAFWGFEEIDGGKRFEKRLGQSRLRVSRLSNADEIGPYLELLNEIWGFTPAQSLPLHEAVVVALTGGLFLGVEIDERRVGVVEVGPAWSRAWGFHHHSNFMGFLPAYRGLGLGFECKRVHAILARRDGISLVTWTYDPLMAANANLNFRKLGGVCSTYLENLYGGMGGRYDSGLPTDRFLVEWRLDDARVARRLDGAAPAADELLAARRDALQLGAGEDASVAIESGRPLSLPIPAGVHEQARSDVAGARSRLLGFRASCKRLFQAGYRVTETIRAEAIDASDCYLLVREGPK